MKNTLKERFEAICAEYIKLFCKKQEMDFDGGWAGGTVGGIVNISDYYFNFDDIRLDIDTNQPKGAILNHYDDNLEAHYNEPPEYINYQSYIKGLRVSKQTINTTI